jgi:hypothetical protein
MEEALNLPPTWLPRAVMEAVLMEAVTVVDVAIVAASHVEDPRVAVGATSSRAPSANSVARRATTSSSASSASIHPGPDQFRRALLLQPHLIVWLQTSTWILEPQIM